MFNLFDELMAIAREFETHGIEYAVCGGLALAIHGFARATKDIDILIKEEDLHAVRELVSAQGFDIDALPMSLPPGPVEIRRISKIAPKDVLTLDLLLVTQATESAWISRVEVESEWGAIWTVSQDGLIHLKRLSSRPQDLVDIARLMEATE